MHRREMAAPAPTHREPGGPRSTGGLQRASPAAGPWRLLVLLATPMASLLTVVTYLRLDPTRWASALAATVGVFVTTQCWDRIYEGLVTMSAGLARRVLPRQPRQHASCDDPEEDQQEQG